MKTLKFASFFFQIEEKCRFLSNFSRQTAEVELPGEFLLPKHSHYHVCIQRFMPKVEIVQVSVLYDLFSSSAMPRQNKLDHLSRSFSLHLIITKQHFQWVETNPSNICIFPTDIRFIAASWFYANGLIRMLPDVRRFGFHPPQHLGSY